MKYLSSSRENKSKLDILYEHAAMPDITQVCQITGKEFVVTEWEQQFLEKMDMPLPALCLEERHRRRLSHRNQQSIYKNTCALCKKSMISMYSPDKPYTVYCQDCWWSDNWDGKDYGRDIDFTRPFFEQFAELQLATPRMGLANTRGENSEYCNITTDNKNCYLVFGGDCNEDCYYSVLNFSCKDAMDVYWVEGGELVYDSVDCNKCYLVSYSQYANNCRESSFLYECRNCEKCFGCVNLRSKKYHIFNEPYSPEEYEKKIAEFQLNTWSGVQRMKQQFEAFRNQFPHRSSHLINAENCQGENIVNAKNCINCFDIFGPAEDCKDSFIFGYGVKDMLSSSFVGHKSELVYEVFAYINGSNCAFCSVVFDSSDCYYCDYVTTSHDMFGCTSLQRSQYCILNKQYSKEEYFELRQKLINHMKETGEYGLFFPTEHSPFGYNETVAFDYHPLSKEEVLQKGWKWNDYSMPVQAEKTLPAEKLPDAIEDIPDDILNWALVCQETGQPFKIIPAELKFYRQHGIPIPRQAPDYRNRKRYQLRAPWKSWNRSCDKCQKGIVTSYSPERPETVYCEECYLAEVM